MAAVPAGEEEDRGVEGTLGGPGRKQMDRLRKPFLMAMWVLALAGPAFGMDAPAEGAGGGMWHHGLIALAAGLGLGLAAFGAALGQGRATAAAMESIGRNPNSADRIFTPLIVGLALMEALALYGLVIAFMLQAKI
ncbi:MAG: ATP synthase F0 subunit C [Candidatus Rokuibacteriota bacterium]